MPTAEFSIRTLDPSVPRRLLGVEPRASTAREIHRAGVLLYRGVDTDDRGLQRHEFVLEFTTPNEAGVVANWMWSTLHGHVSSLQIGDEEVPVQNAAIKRALLSNAHDRI
jgi:hypothetical protein